MPAPQQRAKVEGISLRSLVDVAMRTRAENTLMRAPARRQWWAGDDGQDLTIRALDRDGRRLAQLLGMSRLPAGAQAFILAPLGPEAVTAMLGAIQAGYRPTFLPISASQPQLQEWIDGAGPSLAIGLSRCGEIEPARILRDCAARSFSARLVCAFGASPPDGVVPLAPVFASEAPLGEIAEPAETSTIVSETSWGERQEFAESVVIDAAVELSRLSKLGPHARILTMMTGVTTASLASGPYLSLLTGAELLPLGLFSLSALWAGLADGKPVCLVAPEALEGALLEAGVLAHQAVASVVFLHRSLPTEALKAKADACRMIDLVPTPAGGWIAVERQS